MFVRKVLAGVVLCACATGSAWADSASVLEPDRHWIPVSGSLTVDYETKVLSYGLPDSDDPNFLPYGSLTFFDTFSAGAKFYIDTSRIGERMGRGDCSWNIWEVDFPADLRHTFTPEEVPGLPTSVEVGVGYRYEYHPRRLEIRDTQFWLADVSLLDLWLVPCLSYERDVIRDHGTYLNLCISKELQILENVSLTPALAQGWGDCKRVRSYLPAPDLERGLNRAGLMDTMLKLTVSWQIAEGLTLAGFVAYSDFLFDRHVRDASRSYIRQCDGGRRNHSWSFPCGISLTYEF